MRINKLKNNINGFGHHIILPIIVIAVLAFAGVRVWMYSHAANNSVCQADPSAVIAALPSGAIWNGHHKCYLVSQQGIAVQKPLTLENATFFDQTVLVKNAPNSDSVRPIIHVANVSNVNLRNLTLKGTNTVGGYHGLPWVGEEGIKLNSSHNVNITHVTTVNTFGDGLLIDQAGGRAGNSTNIYVNHLVVKNAGRQGVTVGYASNSTLSNVNIISSADTGWDFESDTGGGSGNVTINNAQGKGVHLIEALNGPITFNNSNFIGHIVLEYSAATSGQPVTFNGGTVDLPSSDPGVTYAGILVKGPGNLTFNNVKFTQALKPNGKPATDPGWSAVGGAHLMFINSPVVGPTGSNDSSSRVTIK